MGSSKKINRRKQLEDGADGASCRKNNDCRDGSYCVPYHFFCHPLVVEGGTCHNHDNNQCEGALLCSRHTHQCTKPLKVGDACAGKRDLCSAGLFCSIETHTCSALGDLGDSCSGNTECSAGLDCSIESRVCIKG